MARRDVEIEIRDVTIPARPFLDPCAARVILGRRSHPEERALSLQVGIAEAHALQHELRGQETMRSQTVRLCDEITSVLGGHLVAARLIKQGPHLLTAVVEIATPDNVVALPAEPGQALAIAVRLRVPLFADPAVFPADLESTAPPLSPAIVNFLNTLDLGD